MKLGIVIYSNDPEIVWNAFRVGNFSLKNKDIVRVFLLAKGVECESLESDQFNIDDEMKAFVKLGGEILACGTCLKIRGDKGSEICPLSSMVDLYEIVSESDKILTF